MMILHYTKLVPSIIHVMYLKYGNSAVTEGDSKISCHKWKNKPADLSRHLHPCEGKITVESQVCVCPCCLSHNGLPTAQSATQLASCTVRSDTYPHTLQKAIS